MGQRKLAAMTRWFTSCGRIGLIGLALALAGCPQIDGGAVEVAWVLRHSDNAPGKCDDSNLPAHYHIDRLRLRVVPEQDPGMDLCATVDSLSVCEFSCGDGGGASAFDIPPGTYFFDLVPLTSDGSIIPSSVISRPPPLRRTIVEGDIADLGIWQLVIFTDE